MMFKLCRYPPNCPNNRYITGLLASPDGPDEQGTPPYLQPYTRRLRPDPIINASAGDSIEDPSNGWMDPRGTMHMIVHVGQNRGGSVHSTNGGVDWVYDLKLVAYPSSILYTDGDTWQLDERQEPRMILGADGSPTHLVNICGTGGLAHTFVCLQPICTASLRLQGVC
jgi:hypothetical protein